MPPTHSQPSIDTSALLEPEQAYYQTIIGVMRWMVEIGRIDITTEVSQLLSFLTMPRRGHLANALHIMSYLKIKHNSMLVLGPTYTDIDIDQFQTEHDWTPFYSDVEEALPSNAPKPLGKHINFRMFVDSDHTGDKVDRRSRTGFLVHLNCALIFWFYEKQNSIESSSFGTEFTAMKNLCEHLRSFRYKLQMMGVLCEGPSFIYGDNQSVLCNTTIPESTLQRH